jgi:hypothetical protein
MASHGLRTTGQHTGNFGKPKVQGKTTVQLSQTTLSKPNLNIPTPEQAYSRLKEAYAITTDPKLKAGLLELLKSYKAKTSNSPMR